MEAHAEQMSLFEAPKPLWVGGPHPRSLVRADDWDGGPFDYGRCDLFFGRHGIGPLRVAMDTSVLIDYAEFGEAIWSDDPLGPLVAHLPHCSELLALADVMNLWMMRDIRLHVFDRQLTDCKREMSAARESRRLHQVRQLQATLTCLGHGTDHVQPSDGATWPRFNVPSLPAGADAELVGLAFEAGCHVFLTRDEGLLRHADVVATYWLALMRPSELRAKLASGGELRLASEFDSLLPDSHKFVHGMAACEVG